MFEEGDFVRIKKDFEKYRNPGDPGIDPKMLEFAGKTGHITKKTDFYRISCAPHWVWDEDWLELALDEPTYDKQINIDEDSFMGVFQNV